MKTNRFAYGIIALLSPVLGCSSGPSFGEPTTPTSSQMTAVSQADGMGDELQPSKVLSNPNKINAIYGTMASVGNLAVDGTARSGLRIEPQDFPSSCITGDATTGYTYTNCVSETVTWNGSVKASAGTVTVDLTITTTGGAANTKTTLKGTITATETSVLGDMAYKVSVDLGAFGGLAGAAGASGDISTNVKWNITNIQTTPTRCISAGTIQIDSSTANQSRSALFEWTGCGMFTVSNST